MAWEGAVRDIFISHVEENSDLAIAIAGALETAGFSTWYYERDSLPGLSYLLQTSGQIEAAQAVLLIISPHSLSSHQVTKEVIRAHESGKPFIPVLHEISHVEFGNRQPEWREAVGSATSVTIPSEGVPAILPRILSGVRGLGVTPSGTEGLETPQPIVTASRIPAPTAPTAVKKVLTGPSLWPKVALAAVTLVAFGYGAFALTSSDEPAEERPVIETQIETQPSETPFFEEVLPEEEVAGEPPDLTEDFASTANKPIKTSAGKFRVDQAILTKEACPPPQIPEPCYVATGSDRYVVVSLVPDGGGTAALSQVFSTEAHQSSLGFGAGLQAGAYRVSLDMTQNTVEVIYGIVNARAAKEKVFLYWPKNPTLILAITA